MSDQITAKKAAQIAVQYYKDVTSDYRDVTIEEIDKSDDGSLWHVTIGHFRQTPRQVPYLAGLSANEEIVYKIITLRVDNGEVVSMKIRQ